MSSLAGSGSASFLSSCLSGESSLSLVQSLNLGLGIDVNRKMFFNSEV